MSSRQVTIAGYLLCVAAGIALQLRSRVEGSRIPSIQTVVRRVMRTRPGRVGMLAGWAWLGLHFFAR